ncbi:hypothetical protein MUK42_36361 [Musa troglodytarum]|uniref:Uncharacterized protein n=1 Tax=Musa troglodytarum TaxID=320322 RepID=A0A9E7FMA9_9LILI|nr:hypothetical protein MUK42_36361 [Musa troglodytarum]
MAGSKASNEEGFLGQTVASVYRAAGLLQRTVVTDTKWAREFGLAARHQMPLLSSSSVTGTAAAS